MVHVHELESFIASQMSSRFIPDDEAFRCDMTPEQKRQWIVNNANLARRLAFKMRGVGRTTWQALLTAHGLGEKYTLVPYDEADKF